MRSASDERRGVRVAQVATLAARAAHSQIEVWLPDRIQRLKAPLVSGIAERIVCFSIARLPWRETFHHRSRYRDSRDGNPACITRSQPHRSVRA
jgi:hypothetical protein